MIFPIDIDPIKRISEFAIFIVLGFLFLALLLLAINKQRLMLTSFICCGILSLFLKGESNASLVMPALNQEENISIAHLNLSSIEDNYQSVFAQMDSLDADIISFQEVTPDWHAYLKEHINEKYPYDHSNVRIDLYGKAIYSKLPLNNKTLRKTDNIPMLECNVEINQSQIKLASCYISETFSRKGSDLASNQLQTLSGLAQQSEYPLVVVGDFNLVYWDPEIRSFRDNSGINNSRRTVSLSSFSIPYDHIFYSDALECTLFKELEDRNTTHIGVYGTYQFRYNQ